MGDGIFNGPIITFLIPRFGFVKCIISFNKPNYGLVKPKFWVFSFSAQVMKRKTINTEALITRTVIDTSHVGEEILNQ